MKSKSKEVLTALHVKNAVPRDKPYRLFDGSGLYIQVSVTGSRCWRLKYFFAGREKVLSFGVYPEVSLSEARDRRDDARRLLRDGFDPAVEKRLSALAQRDAATNSFEAIACEWLDKQTRELDASTHKKARALFETWAVDFR